MVCRYGFSRRVILKPAMVNATRCPRWQSSAMEDTSAFSLTAVGLRFTMRANNAAC